MRLLFPIEFEFLFQSSLKFFFIILILKFSNNISESLANYLLVFIHSIFHMATPTEFKIIKLHFWKANLSNDKTVVKCFFISVDKLNEICDIVGSATMQTLLFKLDEGPKCFMQLYLAQQVLCSFLVLNDCFFFSLYEVLFWRETFHFFCFFFFLVFNSFPR